jgi:hypothetical protein
MKPCLQEEILQAYLDGELAKEASDDVVTHLAECVSCAARVREAELTLMAIGSAVENELPVVIPTARLRARIESGLVEKAAPKFTLTSLLNWKLAAVTAGILLVLSAMAIFWQSARRPQHKEQAALPTPVSTPGSQTTPPNPTEPPVDRDRVVAEQSEKTQKRVRPRTSTSNSEEAEVVTQFFPLREGEDLAALESVRMVRVELPGSALSEVGLSVNPETANASVKADVLLGDDGLARAIRFVR